MKLFFKIILIILSLAIPQSAFCQITPPGLDETKSASWLAIGVSQKLTPHLRATVYAGSGRQGDPDNFSLFEKQSILVFNEETLMDFNSHWQLAFCASYRRQNRYIDEIPYSQDDPNLRNEKRFYLRLYYKTKIGKTNFNISFRPEYRSFTDEHHEWYPKPLELRFRLKAQAAIPLTNKGGLQFIIADEFLSATDHIHNTQGDIAWTEYQLTENRLSTYLRKSVPKTKFLVDFGFMHQFKINQGSIQYTTHIALDLILLDPFNFAAK